MEIIKQEKTKSDIRKTSMKDLNEKELRVVAYTRVSTDHDDQKNSFDSQKRYYTDKIAKNPNWTFADIYCDEGISGTKTYRREGFIKMMKDAINDRFDLVLTKSVSRFARNTVDTLKFVRILKDKNIGVYFEEENINTLDMNGELLLSILSSIAQQESTNLSAHVLLGLKMKVQQGKMIGSTFCYGYDYNKKDKKLYVNPETSKIVKRIFKMYLEGNGTYKIAEKLTEEGIPTAKGNKVWNEGTITHILRNERYKGDLLLGKYFSSDPITKRAKKNRGERDQYYVRNHHEAVIDEDTWNKVQKIMKERAKPWANKTDADFNNRYAFSGKMICGFCGKTMTRSNSDSLRNPKYYCDSNRRNQDLGCPDSKMIDEEMLKLAFMQMAIKLRRKIKLDDKFAKIVKTRIGYARKRILNRDDLDENKYDQDLSDDILKYVIVGDKTETGKVRPFVLRFILKTEEDTLFSHYKKESINLYKILEFDSHQIFHYFKEDKYGKLKQIYVDKIKTTCEVDLGDYEWKL